MHKTEHSHPQNTALLRIHTWCSGPAITEMKAPLEILFGTDERPAVALFSIYSIDAKWWPQSPILSLWRSQKFQRKRSEEYGGWNLVLQEQLLICVGDVTRQITLVQHSTLFFLLFWSSKPICIRHQFPHHRLRWCHDCTNFGHIYSLPHLTLPHHHPVQGRSRIYIPTE
jgi:hypothetical protein